MLFFYIFILILILWRIRIDKPSLDRAMSKDVTNSIKGIFILIVLLRHAWPYILPYKSELNIWDSLFCTIDILIRQLLVVMFLFYSGYGVTLSILKKGSAYIKGIPGKRILITIANVSVAIFIYMCYNYLIEREYSLSQYILATIGWTSVGQSNWYIFCILCCYLFSYLSFRWCKENIISIILIGILCISYVLIVKKYQIFVFYDTIGAYWLGCAVAVYYDIIKRFLEKNYLSSLTLSISLFVVIYLLRLQYYGAWDNLLALPFALMVMIFTMKIHIQNKLLIWLGVMLFPIYIYQRLPFHYLSSVYDGILVKQYPYLFILLVMLITLGIAKVYHKIEITTDTIGGPGIRTSFEGKKNHQNSL